MPLDTIAYAPGQPLQVHVTFGFAQVGAYSLFLWDKNGSTKEMIGEGVNTDNVPDEFPLTQQSPYYDGRILDCIATVINPNPQPGDQFSVDMIVMQNGAELGRISDSGAIASKSISLRLAARLTMKQGGE